MKHWKIINKKHDNRPSEGTYESWKPFLRDEGENRCVYCSILDARLGGVRIFHVEHFKPKKNDKFPQFSALENDYDNLFYVCPVCNTFKGNSWYEAPEGDWTISHFPNPSIYDYGDFFEINFEFKLEGTNNVGKFLVTRLHLNRMQLIRERKLASLLIACSKKIDKISLTLKNITDLSRNEAVIELYQEFTDLQIEYGKLKDRLIQNAIYAYGETA